MSAPQDYSVIIRCYNEEEHIGKILSGVLAQNIKPKEIIVVDSGSTDATLSIASRFPVNIVNVKKEEFSFGRSLNRGCHQASSPILLIASAHVYPLYKNWAELLLGPFKDPEVALVYGKQIGDEYSRYSEHRVLQKWFPDYSLNGQKHPFCNNANAAIRRSLWEKFPYDEHLTGLEDLDWAKRITQHGQKIVYQAPAVVVHVHNETYAKIYNRYFREALALKKIYPEERFGKREFLKLLTSNISSDWADALKNGQFTRHFADIFMFRLMQFSGSYKGFKQGTVKLKELKGRFYYPHDETHKKPKDYSAQGLTIDYSRMTNKNEK